MVGACPSTDSHDRRLAALHAPRRNRYFAGKLLDPAGLQMEQEYSRGADAQLSRLVLGAGVVCGLDVTAGGSGDDRGIRVSPGLALDGWGRRIVVPCETDVLALPADAPRPATMVVRLRYHAHAADPVPVPVPADADQEDGSQAATWIEAYRVEIREETAPAGRTTAPRWRSSSCARDRSPTRWRRSRGRHAPLPCPTPV